MGDSVVGFSSERCPKSTDLRPGLSKPGTWQLSLLQGHTAILTLNVGPLPPDATLCPGHHIPRAGHLEEDIATCSFSH